MKNKNTVYLNSLGQLVFKSDIGTALIPFGGKWGHKAFDGGYYLIAARGTNHDFWVTCNHPRVRKIAPVGGSFRVRGKAIMRTNPHCGIIFTADTNPGGGIGYWDRSV